MYQTIEVKEFQVDLEPNSKTTHFNQNVAFFYRTELNYMGMSLFPKVVIVFGISGTMVVPFMVLMQKGNDPQDVRIGRLSQTSAAISPKVPELRMRNDRSLPDHTSSTHLVAKQRKKKKKAKKKPVIKVGREPVQLGNRTLRILQDTQPPKIKVITPVDPSYVMNEWITIRARSEAGSYLSVGKRPLLETAKGVFVGKVKLQPGKNLLIVHARDSAGNTSETTIGVTWIDENKIRRTKDRLKALLLQLDEIQKMSQEIDARTEGLIQDINSTQDADIINRLSTEQQEIRNTKLIIQAEIEKAIKAIDNLLAKRK